MRRELHSVDPYQGSNLVRPTDDGCHVVYRTYGIGGVAHCYELRAFTDLRAHVFHVQGHVFDLHIDSANDDSALLQCEPGSNISIMIKGSYNDFVTSLQRLANSAAEGKGESGHIGAKDDFSWTGGMQEVGHCAAGGGNHLVGAMAGDKSTMGIGIRLAKVCYHGVYDLLCDLGPTRVIEIDSLFVIDGLRKRREVATIRA